MKNKAVNRNLVHRSEGVSETRSVKQKWFCRGTKKTFILLQKNWPLDHGWQELSVSQLRDFGDASPSGVFQCRFAATKREMKKAELNDNAVHHTYTLLKACLGAIHRMIAIRETQHIAPSLTSRTRLSIVPCMKNTNEQITSRKTNHRNLPVMYKITSAVFRQGLPFTIQSCTKFNISIHLSWGFIVLCICVNANRHNVRQHP